MLFHGCMIPTALMNIITYQTCSYVKRYKPKTMETIKNLFTWWRNITPPWLRLAIALIAVAFCFVLSLTSCSTTRAVIRQPKDSSVTHISISTHNPVDVNSSPNVSTNLNPLK